MNLKIQSTPLALWYQLIQDAESKSGICLLEELESYLIFLLMRYSKRPEIGADVIATDYLTALNLPSGEQTVLLQEVGDKCLLFSGLFPHLAAKRLVKISYYVAAGQSAYAAITGANDKLFKLLANHFVKLMDVLQTTRHLEKDYSELQPFEAYDLWNETHSKQALEQLKYYTNSLRSSKK